ncbi:unnamed protein product [Candidula unifasciata]|uniref:C2H2-type domain-containing protein n=1 Tax=Candidula unifasciata TaxID=100452 RepID=A0A8S4AG35_9EUPU|nr:unnamed protein product [Candidula unifasciata]
MALVMSTLPFGLVYGSQNSQNHTQPGMTRFSSSAQEQQDDQPLDLSRKAVRSASFSTTETKMVALRHRSCSDSATTIPLPATDFSSLRSLQQRFGDDVPLHPLHKSATSVIPLPANITCKSAVSLNGVRPTNNGPPSAGLQKLNLMCQVDTPEEHDMTAVDHGVVKEESNMVESPMLGDEPASSGWSRHTTHRCSCQNTFSTLYSLSLHLQETGHTPISSKQASPMDYPKLVRGQDMWLNQESEQTRRILRCIQCGQSFESLPLLTVHMMQTQHYTKIVNSDHARRPHKCSTYCGRELHQECVFKCKVCHKIFGDMEKLASHMVVSGHHIKQMPRHVLVSGHHIKQMPRHLVDPAAVPGDGSATSRQGKRKRFSQDDMLPIAASRFTVASLNYRRKHERKDISSGHSTSPESVSVMLATCGICEKNMESQTFNSHVRECLRQKVEVVELMGNRLALKEDLSRSEGQLLKPNCSVDSATHQQKISCLALTKTESVCSEDESGCLPSSEKSLSENSVEIMFPERRCSTPLSDPGQMIRHSASSSTRLCASPSTRLCASPSTKYCASPSTKHCASPSTKHCASPSTKHCASPSTKHCASPSTKHFASPSTKHCALPGTRLCDLYEVPHKKLCSHSESRQEVNRCFMSAGDDNNWPVNFNKRTVSSPINQQKCNSCFEPKNTEPETSHKEVAHTLKSELRHGDDGLCDSERDLLVFDDLSKIEQHRDRRVLESTLESLDYTYSALYKLDLFSRGLQLSPPKRTNPLETKLLSPKQSKVTSKKEPLPIYLRSPISKSPPGIRSPHTVSSPHLQYLKPESPSTSNVNMTFDIINPEVDLHDATSAPSALEAMESFINKSFSATPQLCSPSLTSMLIPLRNYFPDPGSLLSHAEMLLDSPNEPASQLAKFSRFFKMVPGIPKYSRSTLSPAGDAIKREANINCSELNTSSPAALMSLSEYHQGAFTLISAGLGVSYKLELPQGYKKGTICQADDNSKNNRTEVIPTIKKENYKCRSSPDLFAAQKSHVCGSSPDAMAVQENHTFDSTPVSVAKKNPKHSSFANHLIAEQNHKYISSLETMVGETVAQDLCRLGDKILGNTKAHCTDDSVLSGPFFVKPVNSSAGRLAHDESLTVGQERQRNEEFRPNLGTVSSTRGTGLFYSQQGDPFVTTVKSENNEEDTMWKGDEMSTNDNIANVSAACKSQVNIKDVKIQFGTELVNNELSSEVKMALVQMVAQNSNGKLSPETTKLTLQTEVGQRQNNREVAEDVFNIRVDESKVDTDISVKTEREEKPIKERVFVKPNEEKAKEKNLNLSLEIPEHKMYSKPTATNDKFGRIIKLESCLCVNDRAETGNESFVTDFVQQDIGDAVSRNVYMDILTESLKDAFGKEHETSRSDSSRSDSCRSDSCRSDSCRSDSCRSDTCRSDSCRSDSCRSGSHKENEMKLTTSTKSTWVERETVPDRDVLCGVTNCENDFLSCDISDMDVNTENRLDRHFDDLISDMARKNIPKGKCTNMQIKIENIVDDEVISDTNISQNLNMVSMKNVISTENSSHSVCHNDNDCAVSRNWCENVIKLEVPHSGNDVHRGEGKEDTGVEHNNERHCKNNSGSQLLGFDCQETGSSKCKNKSLIQCGDTLTHLKSVYVEKIVRLKNEAIKEKYQYKQAGVHEKKNQETSVQIKNPKFLSESETNLNASKVHRMKNKKSALDYLSSFVYSQPLSTEHPLDNLQRLLATNDLSHLSTDPDHHSVDAPHNCCSSDMFTSPSMISGRGQTCSTCDTEDNEDDETYMRETGTGESNVNGHNCGACRRRFVSKGSYRYHLSRCHLSSVKKYSIKETFSRSPYVYLPLDHTVKFYQMTQELSSKGK